MNTYQLSFRNLTATKKHPDNNKQKIIFFKAPLQINLNSGNEIIHSVTNKTIKRAKYIFKIENVFNAGFSKKDIPVYDYESKILLNKGSYANNKETLMASMMMSYGITIYNNWDNLYMYSISEFLSSMINEFKKSHKLNKQNLTEILKNAIDNSYKFNVKKYKFILDIINIIAIFENTRAKAIKKVPLVEEILSDIISSDKYSHIFSRAIEVTKRFNITNIRYILMLALCHYAPNSSSIRVGFNRVSNGNDIYSKTITKIIFQESLKKPLDDEYEKKLKSDISYLSAILSNNFLSVIDITSKKYSYISYFEDVDVSYDQFEYIKYFDKDSLKPLTDIYFNNDPDYFVKRNIHMIINDIESSVDKELKLVTVVFLKYMFTSEEYKRMVFKENMTNGHNSSFVIHHENIRDNIKEYELDKYIEGIGDTF